MQLRSHTNHFEIPNSPKLRNTKKTTRLKHTISEVGDEYLTRDEFLKKVRLVPPDKPASASEINAFRNHFQVAFSLFGLSSNVYECLRSEDSLTHALRKLLITSMDILDEFVDGDDK